MKMIFKLILPLFCLFIVGCAKEYSFEKQLNPFHLNYTVDGVQRKSVFFAAGDFTDPGNGELYIYGVTDSVQNSHSYIFSFEIVNHSKITVGEYTDADPDVFSAAVYTDSSNVINYLAGQTILQQAISDGMTINNHFTVNVTSFENHSARGTFSGDFYDNGDPHGKMVKITDGDFYIKMK
ncbi:MAG: hypothetical protein QM764_08055 [Chitinophagaceae bacterium]